MEEDRALTLLQAAIASYVADLHTPVAAFLDQSADQREPSNIPLLLHSLDDLIYFLTQEVKGKLPMQEYNNHLQGTRSYRDQLAACHQSLLHGHTPHQARRIVPSARGWSLDVNTVLLQHLDKNGFTDVEIGKHLGCSRWTVRRRRAALGSQPKRQQKHRYTEEDLIEVSDQYTSFVPIRIQRLKAVAVVVARYSWSATTSARTIRSWWAIVPFSVGFKDRV